jgi:HEPN domain-containing protein
MNEFTKLKVTFSLALLAVLFTLSPILSRIGSAGYEFITVKLEIRFVYYLFATLLAITVYFYGIELITEKPIFNVQKIANISYALAILLIPLYFLLFLVVQIAQLLGLIIKSTLAVSLFSGIVGSAVGVLVSIVGKYFVKKLSERDRNATVEQLASQEVPTLLKAADLLKAGYYDSVLVECFKVIAMSIRKLLISQSILRGRSMVSMLRIAEEKDLLPKKLLSDIDKLRSLRNEVAHGGGCITKDAAEGYLALTREVLAHVDRKME